MSGGSRRPSTTITVASVSLVLFNDSSLEPLTPTMSNVKRPPRPSIDFQKAVSDSGVKNYNCLTVVQLQVQIEKTVSRDIDGEITEVNVRSTEESSPVDSIFPSSRRARYASDVIHIV